MNRKEENECRRAFTNRYPTMKVFGPAFKYFKEGWLLHSKTNLSEKVSNNAKDSPVKDEELYEHSLPR